MLFASRVMPEAVVGWRRAPAVGALRLAFALVALYEILSTSIISIPANQVGIVRKIYGFSNLSLRPYHRHARRDRLSGRHHPSGHVSHLDLLQCAQ